MSRYLSAPAAVLFISISLAPQSVRTAGAEGFPAKEVYETYSPAVVVIRAVKSEGGGSIGTGSIITRDGHVITNAHVVIDPDTDKPFAKLGVYIKPSRLTGDVQKDLKTYMKAKVLRYDTDLDLALMKIKDFSKRVNIIELANPNDIMVGEEVIAIGHPEQGGFWSLTYGRISGQMANQQGIKGKDVYQTDTSVNRGNSGGPLLDRRGYMVAVNTNIARVGAGGLPITGVNFSLKSEVVKKWLGEVGYKVSYGTRPLEVGSVESGGGAAEDKKAAEAEKRAAEAERKAALAEKRAAEAEEKAAEAEKRLAGTDKAAVVEAEKKRAEAERRAAVARKKAALAEKKAAEAKAAVKTAKTKPEKKPGKKFETKKRPYDRSDALKAAEKDLENLMEDMKFKIRRK